jgi:hypothetical protein
MLQIQVVFTVIAFHRVTSVTYLIIAKLVRVCLAHICFTISLYVSLVTITLTPVEIYADTFEVIWERNHFNVVGARFQVAELIH